MFWLLLIWNLMAGEVVIQGENVTDLQYQQFILQNPEKQSYISSLEAKNNDGLMEELKRGQFHFLKGSLNQAKIHFKNISDQRFEQDWKKEERKAIHYSLFRLAQLEQNPKDSANYILQALQLDDEIIPNKKLFPPPLITKYNQLKSDHKIQAFPLPKKANLYSRILINGKKVEGSSTFFRARPGEIRIRFMSNRLKDVILVSKAKNIQSSKLTEVLLATGPCENPELQFAPSPSHHYSLHNGQCQSSPIGTQTLPKALAKHSPRANRATSKSFYKSKWFWVGVGVLVSGLAYHHVQQQNRGTSPPQPATKKPREISN